MADPFSAFTGALSVADVCISIGSYLRSVLKAAKNLDEEIGSLEKEISDFKNVYNALEKICNSSTAQHEEGPSHDESRVENPEVALWTRAADLVREGHRLVEKFKQHLQSILGSEPSNKFHRVDQIRKAIKLLAKDNEYKKLRKRFTELNIELNTMFIAIQLTSNSVSRSGTFDSLDQLPAKLSRDIQALGIQLKAQIETLEATGTNLKPSILSAQAAVAFTSLNKHFYVQKPDTSIWTGRKKYLDKLRDAMLSQEAIVERMQKRFVVYGISGAGKTQFCCKFAQDYRESFWGIFWIDASNVQNASESWKKIAKIGGKDANEEAGRFWLSNLQSPWLLIIDGADGSEESIKKQLPSGDRGHILITTRNPRMSINANIGSITLDRLEEHEADELLRKATKHEPWDVSAKISALSIAKHLGYLPLALIHAGRAIYHQLCTLQGYIPFFNKVLNEHRLKKSEDIDDDDDDDTMGVFTSFDIIYSGLEVQSQRLSPQGRVSQDAIELINIFSFLHNIDIDLDILVKAGSNLKLAATPQPQTPSTSIQQRFNDLVTTLYLKYLRPRPVLPRILKVSKDQSFDEPRTRKAIDLLVRMSLLSESTESGRYSMHPLVHMWVRTRLNTSAQALWCEAAADILATSIKIPPMTDETGDQEFYVRVLNHVKKVQDLNKEIRLKLSRNFEKAGCLRQLLWRSNPQNFRTKDALNCAKYSRIYMECSLFEDAEDLQRLVLDFVLKNLGSASLFVVPISIALSVTLWHLGRATEAQKLQEDALQICTTKQGAKHPQTLRVMDNLGETYWQKGWLKEAKALHQSAIDGMEGNEDLNRDRLKAVTHLARVEEWYMNNEGAQTLYEKASIELSDAFGADDPDTLIAKDGLAMTLIHLTDIDSVKRAHVLMQEIYESRRKRLGEENLYTLWAWCNLARTLTKRGSLENNPELFREAKDIFNAGLEIIKRNLGPYHIGTLMGRHFYAHVLVAEKNYDEAMQEYEDIAELQRNLPGSRAGTHRDRLMTMQSIVECCETQGRLEEALQWCDTTIKELDDMGGQQHPWRVSLTEKQRNIVAKINTMST